MSEPSAKKTEVFVIVADMRAGPHPVVPFRSPRLANPAVAAHFRRQVVDVRADAG